jgi:ribosomal protein L11 methyltransferase
MKESWSKITLLITEDNPDYEMVMGWLVYFGVESIIENENNLEAYVDTNKLQAVLDNIKSNGTFSDIVVSHESVENKNWNEVWESNFDSIVVNNVGIRAEFHEKLDTEIEIIIQPKMAFGTGHHETTEMMIDYMSQMTFENKQTLDYGCGTGILSILAIKLGAPSVMAIDIQEEAIDNTKDQIKLNKLSRKEIQTHKLDIESLDNTKYDIILANINRHVLLTKGEEIRSRLNKNGLLIMSGILISDEKKIMKYYNSLDFKLDHSQYKGEWCLLTFSQDVSEDTES